MSEVFDGDLYRYLSLQDEDEDAPDDFDLTDEAYDRAKDARMLEVQETEGDILSRDVPEL